MAYYSPYITGSKLILYMGVSKNYGTPISFILIGFSMNKPSILFFFPPFLVQHPYKQPTRGPVEHCSAHMSFCCRTPRQLFGRAWCVAELVEARRLGLKQQVVAPLTQSWIWKKIFGKCWM